MTNGLMGQIIDRPLWYMPFPAGPFFSYFFEVNERAHCGTLVLS